MSEDRRGEILTRYASTSDPRERQRLAREWLDAGGREIIDHAAERGMAALRRPEANDAGPSEALSRTRVRRGAASRYL